MSETNQNPVLPSNQGQPAGDQLKTGPTNPATDANQSKGGAGQNAPSSDKKDDATISLKELNDLKMKAGRWDARQKSDRHSRREQRKTTRKDDYNSDNIDPELAESIRERDERIDNLSSENKKLAVKDRVRDVLDSDEYKDLPAAIKRAVSKNPLGFANPQSSEVEDVIADIQDYLDDELDSFVSDQSHGEDRLKGNPPQGSPTEKPGDKQQTPPASGSGPSNKSASPFEGTEGKTGTERSTAVFQNLMKNRGR